MIEDDPSFSTESLFPVQEVSSEINPMNQINWLDLVNEETSDPSPNSVSILDIQTLMQAWDQEGLPNLLSAALYDILDRHQPPTQPLTFGSASLDSDPSH